MRLPHLAVILTTLFGWSAKATAADSPLSAKQYYKQAETHYHVGEFNEALKNYVGALRLDRRPHFHFNIAQCYRNLKKAEKPAFTTSSTCQRGNHGDRVPSRHSRTK